MRRVLSANKQPRRELLRRTSLCEDQSLMFSSHSAQIAPAALPRTKLSPCRACKHAYRMSKGCPVARTLASMQDRPQHVTLRARTDALLARHSLERTGTLIGDLRAVVGFDDIRPHEIRTVLASMAPLYRTPPGRCLFDHRSAAAYGAFMDSLPSFLGWTEFRTSATTRNANFVFHRPG